MKLVKYSLIVFCLGFFSVTTYAQDRATLQDLLQSMSEAEKLKVLQYAKQQEKSIEQQILEILDRLPEGNQELIVAYAKQVYQQKMNAGKKQNGFVEREIIEVEDAHEGHDHKEKPTNPQDLTVMTFKQTTKEFGSVAEGEIVERTFYFTNTGTKPLTISNARGSCGCTIPQWPRSPIAPGGKGEIKVRFNTNKKSGKRNQVVTIVANTNPKITTLSLTGEVMKKE